jgi:hypothetical protein
LIENVLVKNPLLLEATRGNVFHPLRASDR